MDKVQVEILGLSTHASSNGAYALILKEVDGQRRLPIIIGSPEAQSIAIELESIKTSRPMTHDLMKTVIETLGESVQEIIIHHLSDGTFFAYVVLSTSGVSIDSRPSDAIALAVRFDAPIFVAEEVLEEASFTPDQINIAPSDDTPKTSAFSSTTTPQHDEAEMSSKEKKLEALEQELKKAIEREDYEKAALLRDEISKL